MQLCFNLIAIYWRRSQDVLPTGLTYMHTHSWKYSRNKYTQNHISGADLGLTANIQVGAISNILTMSQTNSILNACGSPRYGPAYLATKYITKKKKKTDPSPSLLPTPITSWQYVFRFQSPYALLWQMTCNFPFFITFSSF